MQVGRRLTLSLLLLIATGVFTRSAGAQRAGDGWNDAAALELVQRGIERRAGSLGDADLRSYAADGRGYVYFLLDAPELDRQTLVRTDQVALEIYWRAPDRMRQRIVGMRQQKELPVTRLYYYLDRLTVVQDSYGDAIVIADGDNVNDVPHPVAAGAERIYDYRLHDAVTLRLPGVSHAVTIREVQVRPKNPDLPAVVGSVFLAEHDGSLVRMNFTFTPSAYVDPRLDFVNVTLENGLWEGRHWLPYEQQLEIRREMPELDLPFGTVIRTRMRVADYRFNVETPDWLFAQDAPVTLAPAAHRDTFQFEQPIDAERRLEGIGAPADVEELRAEARQIVREQALSGLRSSRLGARSLSEVLRYNRAEGAVVALGWGVQPSDQVRARAHGGWAFGAEHPLLSLEVSPHPRLQLHGYVNRPGDIGLRPGAAGLTNSLGALLFAEDWLDPFYRTGASATHTTPLGRGWSVDASAQVERQRSAAPTAGTALFADAADFRPVRTIDEGTALGLAATFQRRAETVAGGWSAEFRVGGGNLMQSSAHSRHARVEGRVGLRRTSTMARAALEAELAAGLLLGEPPRQELYLLGGRNTLPGYGYREYGGPRFGLVRSTASADLLRPWVRGRVIAAAGWAGGNHEALGNFAERTPAILPALGAGVGLFYDILRVDVVRGLAGRGRTELIVEISPTFWEFL